MARRSNHRGLFKHCIRSEGGRITYISSEIVAARSPTEITTSNKKNFGYVLDGLSTSENGANSLHM